MRKFCYFNCLVGGPFCEFQLWENIVGCQVRAEIYVNQEKGGGSGETSTIFVQYSNIKYFKY